MKIKIKKLTDAAIIPAYAHPDTDAGLDFTAIRKNDENNIITYYTGIAIEIPKNHVGLLFPRSSVYKQQHSLCNCVGVIDSGYRGEIVFKYYKFSDNEYSVGDRVGQLIVMKYPKIEFEEINDLSKTDRGVNGFGSTDSKSN